MFFSKINNKIKIRFVFSSFIDVKSLAHDFGTISSIFKRICVQIILKNKIKEFFQMKAKFV